MSDTTQVRSESRLKWVLDIGERMVSVVLFASFVVRLTPALTLQPLNGLALVSEGLVVVFMLTRRHTEDMTMKPFDWIVAFVGTGAPMLVGPGGRPLALPLVCATLMLLGLLLGIWGKLTLRRSFGLAAANRGVVSSGPYRFVRHPIYAGYILVYVGFLLLNPTGRGGWNAAIYLIALVAMVCRVLAEEKVLARDDVYAAFMTHVRYRLAPGLF